jgi:hypothetical protein
MIALCSQKSQGPAELDERRSRAAVFPVNTDLADTPRHPLQLACAFLSSPAFPGSPAVHRITIAEGRALGQL